MHAGVALREWYKNAKGGRSRPLGACSRVSTRQRTGGTPLKGEATRVCFPYEGTERGGSHVSSLGLIQHLDRNRFEPLVVLSALEGGVYELFQEAGVPVIKSPVAAGLPRGAGFSPTHIWKILPTVSPLTRFLKEQRIDIVHTNDGRSHAMWAAPAKLSGAKLFWHHRSGPGVLGLRYVAPLMADQVASVSRFSSPKPGFYSAANKNEVVYSPFDISIREDRDPARRAIIEELGVDPATILVGYFGTFNQMKRPRGFVDAIAAMGGAHPVLGLMFGPDDDERIKAVKAHAIAIGVADKVKFMGYRSPGAQWMAGCDLLLVPAVGEPFGRTLVEAMLVETPIVATDAGGNPEAVVHEETGVLVPPDDPQALAQAALRVLFDPDLQGKIVHNAREMALSRFGEEKHAQSIMALYDRMLTV